MNRGVATKRPESTHSVSNSRLFCLKHKMDTQKEEATWSMGGAEFGGRILLFLLPKWPLTWKLLFLSDSQTDRKTEP
jgi:hypothetical protein